MTPRHLTVFEHRDIAVTASGDHGTLSTREAELLSRLAGERPGLCTRGYASVSLGSWCGVVGIGSRVLEILPKLDSHEPIGSARALLLNMLQKAGALPAARFAAAGQSHVEQPLLEVFIAAFFQAVFALSKGGLLRRYELHAEDLRVVRGRIVLRRQVATLADRRDVIACAFDELTSDNAWNQTLKAAVRVVRPWIASSALSREWAELMGVLDEVSDRQPEATELSELRFDRLAQRYRPAMTWARWILALLSPTLRAGRHEAPALLFDMNRVFQDAVAAQLARALPDDAQVVRQDASRWLGHVELPGGRQNVHRLIPDLVISRRGRVVVIADTKWKVIPAIGGVPEIAPSDVYQMLAYAAAYEVTELVLLVPATSSTAPDALQPIRLPSLGAGAPTLRVVRVAVGDSTWSLDAICKVSATG